MQDNRKVAKTGLITAGAAGVCRLASVGKEYYVAILFGAGVVTDTYAWAVLIPAIGISLFVNAVRRTFLIQYPHRVLEDNDNGRQFTNQFLSSLMAMSTLAAAIVVVVSRGCWRWLPVARHEEVFAVSYDMLLPASLLIIPIAGCAGFTAALNARRIFSAPQLMSIIPTICIMAVLLATGRDWGAPGMLAGLLVGTCLQCLILGWQLRRTGHQFQWDLSWRSARLRALWWVTVPLILMDVATQGNMFVDQAMAGLLPTGRVAILKWAGMIKDALTSTLIASLLLVLLPYFSEQVARGAHDALRHSCGLVIRYGAIVLFPLSALIALDAPLVFQYLGIGQLDQAAVRALALCLIAYGIGLFADLASTGLYQALMALGKIRLLLLLALFANLIPNVVFNCLLIGPPVGRWGLGEVGLALSTSLVGYTTLAANYYFLRREIGIANPWRVVVGALLATCALYASSMSVTHYATQLGVHPLAALCLGNATGIGIWTTLLLVWPGSEDARLMANLLWRKAMTVLWRQN